MTTLIATWLAFNAGAATVVLWRYWCERRMDREADREPFVQQDLTPYIEWLDAMARESGAAETPLYDALLLEDWRREVWTLADAELAELVEEEGS